MTMMLMVCKLAEYGRVETHSFETDGLTRLQVVNWSPESETRVKSKIDVKMHGKLAVFIKVQDILRSCVSSGDTANVAS